MPPGFGLCHMRSSSFKGIVWVVAFAVIALLAVTTSSAVAHELQHAAHHDAGHAWIRYLCLDVRLPGLTLRPRSRSPSAGVVRRPQFFFRPTAVLPIRFLYQSRAPPCPPKSRSLLSLDAPRLVVVERE